MCDAAEEQIPFTFQESGWYIDDIHGQELGKEFVKTARKGEIDGFSSRRVYVVRPRSECTAKGLKTVGVRWVDTIKGDRVRSRLVCKDVNKGKRSDEMFAPTPPLLASRWLVSLTASQGLTGAGNKRLLAIDFTKAFLYGEMEREVYIELPDEDERKHRGDNVGRLLKAMYGLRDAPLIWQKVVREMLKKRGFTALSTAQCVYVNKETGVIIVAHVDDFLCHGDKDDLKNLLKSLQQECDCTGEVLGPGADEVKELKFLGRAIRWTSRGLEWEGDVKHVSMFLEKVGLTRGRPVGTPGIKHEHSEEQKTPMGMKEATEYRGLVALLNFISQDRVDSAFASKEVSKPMATPTKEDWVAVKRVGRYLQQCPRGIYLYSWQTPQEEVCAFTDSDWASCTKTRKSTSGGCVMRGGHLVAHWSRTQQNVALSSAEAELNGICKAAQEGLAARHLAEELNLPVDLIIKTDSSAARGIIQRQGAGKVKHLMVKQLWVQEQENLQKLKVSKVPRHLNCADMLTHHWTGPEGDRMLAAMSVIWRGSLNTTRA